MHNIYSLISRSLLEVRDRVGYLILEVRVEEGLGILRSCMWRVHRNTEGLEMVSVVKVSIMGCKTGWIGVTN